MKRSYKNKTIFMLGILGVTQIIAGLNTSASAVNSGTINFSAEILPSTTVTIPTEPIELSLTPSGSGTFGSTDFNVIVSTNQPGYTLSMNTSSTTLTSSTIDPNTNDFFTIPTLDHTTEGYTESNFTRNRWGIAVNDGNFNAVLASADLRDTDTATNADVTKISLGANLDMMTATGTYETTIDFTVVPKVIITGPQIEEITYMQDFANLSATDLESIKDSMATDTAYTLKDNRDETTYHVQKLADGKIWLLDNLALDLTDSTILNNMTPENTNASTTSLTSLKSGNRSAGDQYATAGVSNWTSSYSYSAPLVNMDSKDVVPDNAPTGGKGNNKIGGYYNFCAASAGSYCYGDGTNQGTSSGDATEDICPAGWRMPTSNTGDYGALANAIYGSTGSTSDATAIANYRNALSLPLSGDFYDGSARYQGSFGTFWSSTRLNDYYMYNLYVSTSGVSPSNISIRNYGLSVRCIIR